MHLVSAALAGRGQLIRGLLFSDLSHQQLPLPELALDAKIDVSFRQDLL
jgi:hypothetical protein